MKLDNESLIHHLWDTHQIVRGKELRTQFLLGTEDQKKELVHYYFLNRCLHYRRIQDPGFFFHVMDRLSQEPEIIERTLEYIHKLFGDLTITYEDCFQHRSLSKKEIWKKSNSINRWELSRTDHGMKNPEDLMMILHREYYAAIERGDEEEAIALRDQVIKSKSPRVFFSGDLFLDENSNLDLYRNFAPVGGSRWDSVGRFYLATRIKDFESYLGSGMNDYDTDFLRLIEYSVGKKFNDRFDIHLVDFSPPVYPIHPPRSIKFSRDCLRIAADFYFDSLTESEKISLLNAEYTLPLDVNGGNVSISPYFMGFISVLRGLFEQKGLTRDSLQILELASTQIESLKDRAFIFELMGHCYKYQENFTEAATNYQQSQKTICEYYSVLVKKAQNSESQSAQYSDKIEKDSALTQAIYLAQCIGKMQVCLADKAAAEKTIDDASRLLDSFPLDQLKSHMYITLAEGYLQCGSEKKALGILEKGVQTISEDNNSFIRSELHQMKNATGKYDKQSVVRRDCELVEERLHFLRHWSEATRDAFQYSLSFEYLSQLLSISPDPKTQLDVGKECFKIGYYSDSVNVLANLTSQSTEFDIRRDALLYSSICHILMDDVEKGISELDKMISVSPIELNNTEMESTIRWEEVAADRLFSLLLKRGLWQGESRIVAIIDDLKNQILQKSQIAPPELHDIISTAYFSVGWTEKELDEEIHALESLDYNSDSYLWFCYAIGLHHLRKGDKKEGIRWLKRAVEHPAGNNNPGLKAQVMSKMAHTYFQMSKFNEAKEFAAHAAEINPKIADVFFVKAIERLDEYLANQISFESIHDSDIRSIFKTAEHVFKSQYAEITGNNNQREYDLSLILFNYAKGLEAYLDQMIWISLRGHMFSFFSEDGSCIEDDDVFSKIPNHFKMALSKYPERRKTVSLGTWGNIDLTKKENNRVVREINKFLKQKYGKDFEIIRSTCATIAPYRNLGGHKEVIRSPEEMIERRNKMIPAINAVIRVVSSKTTVS